LELPSDLVCDIKLHSAQEGRKLHDAEADLLRTGLAAEQAGAESRKKRVSLPLIECKNSAVPGSELTPDKVAATLLQQEAEWQS
jgi:hypothetical protein